MSPAQSPQKLSSHTSLSAVSTMSASPEAVKSCLCKEYAEPAGKPGKLRLLKKLKKKFGLTSCKCRFLM